MAQGIVYLIINKETGHKYIDTTTLPMNKEWQNHIQSAGKMSSKLLHRAFRQFGLHKFMIKEIDECDERLLEERKHYWIEQYKPEYNEKVNKPETIDKPIPVQEPVIKKERKSFNTFKPEHRGNGKYASIRIRGTNIKTGEVKEWENSRDAAEEVIGNRNYNSNILKSAKKGYLCYGYRWQLLEAKTLKKPIKGIHKITWVEVYYESISKAIEEMGDGGRGSGLKKALKSKGRYTWKGYMWFYLT